MQLPVIIEPLPNQGGFTARFAGPIGITAEGPTADEAHHRLEMLLKERVQQGAQIRSVIVHGTGESGWLPDDELTREWLQHVEQYRAECDAADRAQLDDDPTQGAKAP